MADKNNKPSGSVFDFFKDMDRIINLHQTSRLLAEKQMAQIIEPLQRRRLEYEIAGKTMFSAVQSSVEKLTKAAFPLYEIINQSASRSNVYANAIEQVLRPYRLVEDQIKKICDEANRPIKIMMDQLQESNRLFFKFDLYNSKKTTPKLLESGSKAIQSYGKLMSSYENLAESIYSNSNTTDQHTLLLPRATRELFLAGNSLVAIHHIDDESKEQEPSYSQLLADTKKEAANCEYILRSINPSLLRAYNGARDALIQTNQDRSRHFLASLRELWTHLLLNIAPIDDVDAWISKHGKEELRDKRSGKPTRRAKLLFVCRNLEQPHLERFIVQGSRTLIDIIEFCNKVHDLDVEIETHRLSEMLSQTESWIDFVVKAKMIHKS